MKTLNKTLTPFWALLFGATTILLLILPAHARPHLNSSNLSFHQASFPSPSSLGDRKHRWTLGIVNGKDAPEGRYPFMAQITITSGTPCNHSKDEWKHLCDGTVLNDDTILTSRTCVNRFSGSLEREEVRVGGVHHDQMAACFKVRKVIPAPEPENRLADIGLIKLEGKIDFEKLGKKVVKLFFLLNTLQLNFFSICTVFR